MHSRNVLPFSSIVWFRLYQSHQIVKTPGVRERVASVTNTILESQTQTYMNLKGSSKLLMCQREGCMIFSDLSQRLALSLYVITWQSQLNVGLNVLFLDSWKVTRSCWASILHLRDTKHAPTWHKLFFIWGNLNMFDSISYILFID